LLIHLVCWRNSKEFTLLNRIALEFVENYVSKENIASIFRVEEKAWKEAGLLYPVDGDEISFRNVGVFS
jgi:hypothetical protein